MNEIFGKQGEEAFHQCESEIISHYMGKENVVVMLEEAVVVSKKNRKLLASEFVAYLQVSTKVQIERWENGRSPVLPIVDRKVFLDKQHMERDHLYEEVAKITINTDKGTLEKDVDEVIDALKA